jgi:transposase
VLRTPDLPAAQLDPPSRDIRLLVDHREDLVGERTRTENRLHGLLHELDLSPGLAPRSLDRSHVLDRLDSSIAPLPGVVAEIARELLHRIRDLTSSINQLERRIAALITPMAPNLLALCGCGPLTAAKLLGEVAGISRFCSRSAFARHNGTAPIPVCSGNSNPHRLNRGGNRQVNAALHRVAITQLRRYGPAISYLQRRMQNRDTKTEAIRALRRRISDEVYRRMLADHDLSVSLQNLAQHAA